ncbi:hypothetical protein ACFU8Q_39360 [Streptomyces sp. NPDC057543]|uniref:hypothetical protein n=1 Tax=Streptomyces sp. NPDC057543 TaxID=3346163 RepID=UPI0036A470FD
MDTAQDKPQDIPQDTAPALEVSVKALLWIVLCAAIAANVSLNFLMEDNGLHIALSVVSGVVVLASGAGLWMLRRTDAQP